MTSIYGFHHICFNKNGKDIFEEQLSTLMSSGLYAASTAIYCSVLGPANNYTFPAKYKIIYSSLDSTNYERPILQFMRKHSDTSPGKYWYIHTKGISHYKTSIYKNVNDWRLYMEYFVIKGWRRCVMDLDRYDIAGVNYLTIPSSHYSGNFWWARSSYIQTINIEFNYLDYYEPEMWICKGKSPIGISYNSSHLFHYNKPYGSIIYKNYPQIPLIFTPGLSDTNSNTFS